MPDPRGPALLFLAVTASCAGITVEKTRRSSTLRDAVRRYVWQVTRRRATVIALAVVLTSIVAAFSVVALTLVMSGGGGGEVVELPDSDSAP
jgi:hypothetical protein